MPSTEFYYLSDEDLGDVIAYIKSMPPTDSDLPASSISFTGRIVMTLVNHLRARRIDSTRCSASNRADSSVSHPNMDRT